MSQFDPNSVNIVFTLNFAQVNLILEGLGELPVKRAGDFHAALRSAALQQIQAAEAKANEPALPEVVHEAQPD
jgi:hypothetical protein